MRFLLDVNVLIALFDPTHVHHDAAHRWFEREGRSSWATCPLVENGLVRIISHPKFRNATRTPGESVKLLADLKQNPGHKFWPDDVSISDALLINRENLLTAGQITDTYLLALCVRNEGALATFDRRLTTLAVRGGGTHLRVIDPDPRSASD